MSTSIFWFFFYCFNPDMRQGGQQWLFSRNLQAMFFFFLRPFFFPPFTLLSLLLVPCQCLCNAIKQKRGERRSGPAGDEREKLRKWENFWWVDSHTTPRYSYINQDQCSPLQPCALWASDSRNIDLRGRAARNYPGLNFSAHFSRCDGRSFERLPPRPKNWAYRGCGFKTASLRFWGAKTM